jgi:hypothetical protein
MSRIPGDSIKVTGLLLKWELLPLRTRLSGMSAMPGRQSSEIVLTSFPWRLRTLTSSAAVVNRRRLFA